MSCKHKKVANDEDEAKRRGRLASKPCGVCARIVAGMLCAALALSLTGCRRGELPDEGTTSPIDSGDAATAGWEPQETTEQVDMSGRRAVEKPTTDNATLKYTGGELEFLPNGFDGELMEIEGAVGREVGEYTATVSLKDTEGCAWADSTIAPIVFAWAIRDDGLSYQVTCLGQVLHITHPEGAVSYSADITMPAGGEYSLDQVSGALTLSYSGVSAEDVTWVLEGSYGGSLLFDAGEDNDILIELAGFSIDSARECPIYIQNAANADISAKKNTENSIRDTRAAAEERKGAVYSVCDLKLKGAGVLNVVSDNNNGIHSKDDLKLQKLTLRISSVDNALKGNDGVVIDSGELTLISRGGDGIKTSNSSLSSKGKQKGSVEINDGNIAIYAARDGIDAAFDVYINGGSVDIYTDRYSSYSEGIAADENNQMPGDMPGDIPGDIPGEMPGEIPGGVPDAMPGGRPDAAPGERPSDGYGDGVVGMSSRPGGKGDGRDDGKGGMGGFGGFGGFGGGGRPGGMGGMGDGNSDKSDVSTQGIKAANEIVISDGSINITSYDDSLHANNDGTIESGGTPLGNVTIAGGRLTLASNDDAIHADGTATVSDGELSIPQCYEGIEGNNVVISGGDISVVSSDDGINGTATSGTAIEISGGRIYVMAGGDGVDSNSRTSYSGIVFSGGRSVIISVGRADSSIDTENGYTFSGGYVLGIGMSGGMGSESANCKNFSSVGKKTTVNLQKDSILTASGIVSVKLPESLNALVVLLGDTTAAITSGASSDGISFDQNGVVWLK